jgi:carboxymethylenebutenolidase
LCDGRGPYKIRAFFILAGGSLTFDFKSDLMSRALILFLFFMNTMFSFSQSCCSVSTTGDFAMFSADPKFISAHEEPVPFVLKEMKGSMIRFACIDSIQANAYLVKPEKESRKYLFIFHEWWGLNDYIKQEAERIQAELGNVNVIAIDYYDGRVTSNRDSAAKYSMMLRNERVQNIIKGAYKYVGSKADVAVLGWCLGGGWAMQASLLGGKKAKVCVMFYGMPEMDKVKLAPERAKVLGIFATKDDWITKEIVSTFEKNMKDLKKDITIRYYEADHAFANPSNPKYNKEYAEDAHKFAIEFLKGNL